MFLEENFLAQVRAIPNPAYSPASEKDRLPPHPIVLHRTATTTINVLVTSLTPTPPATTAFVKVSPDAEIHVAPKLRQRADRGAARSVTSAGKRSAGGRSSASTVRRRSHRDSGSSKDAVFLRGVDRSQVDEWFDEDEASTNVGLKVWVDNQILLSKPFRGITWVSVNILKPAGLREPVDPQKEQDVEKPATKVVARICRWEDGPDARHAAVSTQLCSVLGNKGFVGGLIRIEPAPPPNVASSTKSPSKSSGKDLLSKGVKIIPFATAATQSSAGLRFGGESKQEREKAAQKIKDMYGGVSGLLSGPLTDGMMLPPVVDSDTAWVGGILKLDSGAQSTTEASKSPVLWIQGSEKLASIEVQQEIPKPVNFLKAWAPGEPLPDQVPLMVGIEKLIDQLNTHLSNLSSVLLTGGLGAGKSSLAQLLAHSLRSEYLFHTLYFPCRTLITDETRTSTIKETLGRLFAAAAWGARLGGRSVVVLDDIDKLCPVETELQVGNENSRSRHVSELICSIVREFCSRDSGVVLLATAQSKEAVNNVIIGGHVVREIVSIKAPNKDGRRKVLEGLVYSKPETADGRNEPNGQSWHDSDSPPASRPTTSLGRSQTAGPNGFDMDPNIDLLELAGQTDGYMPGDLVLLASRARSEALIRSVNDDPDSTSDTRITLIKDDFTRALDGFTPASLRNVTLQSSTTRWDSIGGLLTTRQTLLETLQYPTTYAPIFAQCPLRLRSGLLLYGYPGCGKTLLASAVAGECGLNFISVKGPEILNKYIGASEKSVRDLFERAEAARPCVLFFDEFDSIAPKRGHDSTGVTDRVVNQLLTQMDGAEGLSGVYVLAATSRPDLIDPALLRPGRLDKSLICDMPNLEERVDILRAVTLKLKLAPSLLTTGEEGQNLREIGQRTEGYSGADLQAVVYNAQLEAIHDVLGDEEISIGNPSKSKNKTNGVNGASDHSEKKGSGGIPEFTYFRYGDDLDLSSNAAKPASSSQLTERAVIAANLASLKTLRKKQKQLQHQSHAHTADYLKEKDQGPDEDTEKEPTIQWHHIQSALRTTRSSISKVDRERLGAIYNEFVQGRNGDLPSGQGGNEIGGRTSLM